MLKKITRIPTIQRKEPFDIKIDESLKEKIKNNWNKYIEGKVGYWDGDLLSVTKVDLNQNIIEVGKAKFSWLIYCKDNNDLDIRSLFVSSLFKTLDGYYVIIKNNHDNINIIGGIVEESDLENNNLNPDNCLKRELKEELGLELSNNKDVTTYELKYLKLPNPGRNYGFVYTGVLNFSKQELLTYFETTKGTLDDEIKELLLITKEEIQTLDLEGDNISYLKELIILE